MQRPSTANRPVAAILLKLVAVLLFSIMAALVKKATQTVPAGEAVFFRSLCATPVIILWIWQRGELREALIPNNLMGHVWRGVIGTTAMALAFLSLGLLPLPEVTAIGFATPLFTVVLAAMLLGETIRFYRITAVVLGLVGVMIVVAPRLSMDPAMLGTAGTLGALAALGSALMRGLVQIHVRRLVQTEHTAAIVFYFSLTATLLSLLTLPFGWVVPDPLALTLLVSAGLLGGVAQILVTSSYRFGAASMLAPFDYASLIFATILGLVFFDEVPTVQMVAGAILVVAGGVIILWRERQLGLDRKKARQVTDPKA